jgi:Flp pilus assembly protein TadB
MRPAELIPDPFGETPRPWWRSMWRRDRSASAPKRYAVIAGGVGSIAGLSLAGVHGVDHLSKAVIFALVTGLPPWLVKMWWRRRCRRGAEQLLSRPDSAGDPVGDPAALDQIAELLRAGSRWPSCRGLPWP